MNSNALVLLGLLLTVSAVADSSTAHPPATEPASVVPSMPETVHSNATPASTPTPSATPLLTPGTQLTDPEKKKVLSEFKRALANQKSALAHQERSSMRELSAAQNMKQKKWREDQKKARQQFFDQHMSGPERRDYVQAYLKSKEQFDAGLKAEYAAAKKNWAEKSAALKIAQKDQEAKFNESLLQGVRPGPELWPAAN